METLSAQQVIKIAIDTIEENGLQECCTLKHYLEHKELAHAMYIENLEDPLNSYYILYWMVNDKIICIAEVNALDGNLISFTPFTHPGSEHYHNFMKSEEMIREKFHENEVIDSGLVWKPCQESTCSLFPFHCIKTKQQCYFVSISGDIYTELTPLSSEN